MVLYLLFESSAMYAIFERVKSEEANIKDTKVQESLLELKRFSKLVKLKAILPFKSAENALEQINAISEGQCTPFLGNWIKNMFPKKKGVTLGVIDANVGNAISETLGITCKCNELTRELIRGIRLHFVRYIKAMKPADLLQAQLGLGHSYSRSKVKFNVHRVDNMIIQSIALLDQLDKDLNTYSMRVREWYGWHFPEMIQVVKDNAKYCQCVKVIKHKTSLSEKKLPAIAEIVGEDAAAQVLQAAKMSMGAELSEVDMDNILQFATRVVALSEFRASLFQYLQERMDACAPNLTALLGEQVGARLIAHAGSLTNLAKYPASTVQILGAEKALFRALKTKSNTPKYGLIFHSTFIGRAGTKNKGRISRYLANKCSLASRIDSFSDNPSSAYGVKLREQVEERLEFYKSGKAPRKNIDVMNLVTAEEAKRVQEEAETAPKQNKKKRKAADAEEAPAKKKKKKADKKKTKKTKKDKKKKKST